MVSGSGVENPPNGHDVFEVYLRAKAAADAAVEASDLAWTILRPGGLTDDAGPKTSASRQYHSVTPSRVTTLLLSSQRYFLTCEVAAGSST